MLCLYYYYYFVRQYLIDVEQCAAAVDANDVENLIPTDRIQDRLWLFDWLLTIVI